VLRLVSPFQKVVADQLEACVDLAFLADAGLSVLGKDFSLVGGLVAVWPKP